ncbi:MAG: serine hydrolase [Patescibacteria group bacterium]|nr:serine hydrolase [Patescibacteria group bacterium]
MKIKKEINEFTKNIGGKVGFGVWDKKSNFKFFYNEEEKFTAASLNKLFVAGLVFKKVSKGDLDLKNEVSIKENEVVGGTGVIHLLKQRKFILQDLIFFMITESDNTAANKLIDLAGGLEEINSYIKQLGLTETEITHKFMLYKEGDKASTTSVQNLIKYLDFLSSDKLPMSKQFKGILKEQKYRERTAFLIKAPYGLKTADLPHPEAVVHDTGIIFDPRGDILLILLTEGNSDRKKTMLEMQRFAKDIYDYILWEERLREYLNETSIVSLPTPHFKGNSYKFGEKLVYDGIDWGKHLGQDFNIKAGTPIYNIADGIVVYSNLHQGSKEKPNWGNIIIVAHNLKGEIIFSLYGHLGRKLVKEGDKVLKGNKIGEVGNAYTRDNGWWESHLHFGLYKGLFRGKVLPGYEPPGNKKEWIDPLKFFKI